MPVDTSDLIPIDNLASVSSGTAINKPNPFADAAPATSARTTASNAPVIDTSDLIPIDESKPESTTPPQTPGWIGTAGQALASGVRSGITSDVQAFSPFADRPAEQPDTSPTGKLLSEGFSEGWNKPKWWVAHISHGIGESSPSLAAGAAGAFIGSGFGPVGTAVGGAGGFAVGSAMGTIAPAYLQARANNLSHDDAVRQAIAETGVAAGFGALMGLGPAAVAKAIEKPLSQALAEIFVVQPGLGAAQQVSQGAVAGHLPTTDELATGYAENAGMGAALSGTHLLPGRKPTEPEAAPAPPQAPPAPNPSSVWPPGSISPVFPVSPRSTEPHLDLTNPLIPINTWPSTPTSNEPLVRSSTDLNLTPGDRDRLTHQIARSEQLGYQDRDAHQAEYDRIAAQREQQQIEDNAQRNAEAADAAQRDNLQQAATTAAPVLPELDQARRQAESDAAHDQAAIGGQSPGTEQGRADQPAPIADNGVSTNQATSGAGQDVEFTARNPNAPQTEPQAQAQDQTTPSPIAAPTPRAYPAVEDPVSLMQRGTLTADSAKQIADNLDSHFQGVENELFGPEDAERLRKLRRKSESAWNRADDKRAIELDRQIDDIESKASPADLDHLSGVGAPDYINSEHWNDIARDLNDVDNGSRDDAISVVASRLRDLPTGNPETVTERNAVAVIGRALQVEYARGGSIPDFLQDAAQERFNRYGGNADAVELVTDQINRLRKLMVPDNANPVTPDLPRLTTDDKAARTSTTSPNQAENDRVIDTVRNGIAKTRRESYSKLSLDDLQHLSDLRDQVQNAIKAGDIERLRPAQKEFHEFLSHLRDKYELYSSAHLADDPENILPDVLDAKRRGDIPRDGAPTASSLPDQKATRGYRDMRAQFMAETRAARAAGADARTVARDWVLNHGRDSGFEHAVVTDPATGQMISAGTERSASSLLIPKSVTNRAANDPNAGLIIDHNHPGNSANSPGDHKIVGILGFSEIASHTHDGENVSRTRLSPGMRQYLQNLSPQRRYNAMSVLVDQVADKVTDRLQGLVGKTIGGKKFTEEDGRMLLGDLVGRILHGIGAIDYESTHNPRERLTENYVKSIIRDGLKALSRELNDKSQANKLSGYVKDAIELNNSDRRSSSVLADSRDGSVLGQAEAARSERSGGTERNPDNGTHDKAAEGEEGVTLREATAPSGTTDYSPEAADRDLATVSVKGIHKSLPDRVKAWTKAVKDDWDVRFKQSFADTSAALEALERGQYGKLRNAAISPTWQSRMSRGAPQTASYVIGKRTPHGFEGGLVEWVPSHIDADGKPQGGFPRIIPNSKSLVETMAPLFDAKLDSSWANWKIATRAERLFREGREHNVYPEFIKKWSDLPNKLEAAGQKRDADILRAADEGWNRINKAVLDFGEATGLYNKETRKLWEKDGDYLPFYRMLEDTLTGPSSGGRGIANILSPAKRLKGGSAKIADVFDNMMKNVAVTVDRGWRNAAGQLAADLTEKAGILVQNKRAVKVDLDSPESRARLTDIGITDPSKLTEPEKDMYREILSASLNDPVKTREFTVMRDGKRVAYQVVGDPLVLRSLIAIGPRNVNAIMGAMGLYRRYFTKMVTLDPAYAVTNLTRDTIDAWTMGFNTIPVLSSLKGAVDSFKNSSSALALRSAGIIGNERHGSEPGSFRKAVEDRSGFTVLNTARRAYEGLEKIVKSSEEATRIAVYDSLIKKGVNQAEALAQSRDLMDFSMRGDHWLAQAAVEAIPFLGARVTGLYRLYRGFKENPQTVMLRGAMLTGLAMLAWSTVKDDERYKRREEWEKQYSIAFKVGDHIFALPSPFELGSIYMNIPIMVADYLENGRTKQLQDAFTTMLWNNLNFDYLPGVIRPIVDMTANKDSFTGRQIENRAEEHNSPSMRYSPQTSPTATAVGQAIGDYTYLSPERVQFLARAYGGTLGSYMLAAADALGEKSGIYPEGPSLHASQYPLVSRFYRGSDDEPLFRDRYATEFYDLRSRVQQLHADFKTLMSEHKTQEAQQLVRDNQTVYGMKSTTDAIDKQLANIRKQDTMARRQGLPSDQLQQRTDDLQRARNRVLERVRPLIQRAEGLDAPP